MRANLLPRPRVRIGEWFTLEVIAKLQGDLARFDRVVDEDDEEFYWARRRLGIRGELWGRVGFEVERAFGYEEEPWRDVYVNVRASDLFEVRGGKFKVPFGLDNLTSSASNDFIFRALATRTLSPGRAIGGMAHGETDRRRFTYAIGVFDGRDLPVRRLCCSMTMTRGATASAPPSVDASRRNRSTPSSACRGGCATWSSAPTWSGRRCPPGSTAFAAARCSATSSSSGSTSAATGCALAPTWRCWLDRPASRRSG